MRPPFFIVGFQRSGTTLLRLMLDAHSRIAVPLDTTGLWLHYFSRLAEYGDLWDGEALAHLVSDLLNEHRIRLWGLAATPGEITSRMSARTWPQVMSALYQAYAAERGKAFWGDKDPGNMKRIHVVNHWFPQAQFVHIVRDGRDACLSHQKQAFGHNLILPCAAAWREEVWWVRALGAVLGPARYFELRYEDLIAHPANELRKLCAFLDIAYEDAMLRYYETVDASIPDEKRHIWPLIDRPPKADNAELWKQRMPHALRICFEKRAGPVLAELGYETLRVPPSGAYAEELRQSIHMIRQVLTNRVSRKGARTLSQT
jgi:hypothetical protein